MTACTSTRVLPPANENPEKGPSPSSFSICYNHSCDIVSNVALTKAEWKDAAYPLSGYLANAHKEREAIAESISRLEQVVGFYTRTTGDKGRNFPGFGKPGQMDCIDESTNTTTYLKMLEQDGYLRWHEVLETRTRFGIFAGFPHSTAMIREKDTSALYAVDSWFYDNAEKPVVIEYERWKSGWSPGAD